MDIEFIPNSEIVEKITPFPKPAKFYIPDWYKQIPPFDKQNIKFDTDGSVINTSVKMCAPFLDGLTVGYIQETWTDIHIKDFGNYAEWSTPTSPEIVGTRKQNNIPDKFLDGYSTVEFIWKIHWAAKLPKGYSLLVTHPLSRVDLPFFSLSGVIDSDQFYHTTFGSFPFYIKRGFNGIIPAGTPMFQLIPFKRDSWTSKIEPYDEFKVKTLNHKIRRKIYGAYKDMFWQKKDYN